MVAGARKMAPPITWFTPRAVRSHLPSSRRSAGRAGEGWLMSGRIIADMSTSYLLLLSTHVVTACIWVGAAFFGAWFLMPAIQATGPDGGKVMLAVQKRGWIVVLPVIATITMITGFLLYRPYMGAPGNAAAVLGYGGLVALIAYGLGIGVVTPSYSRAAKLAAQAATVTEGADRASMLALAGRLRHRGTLFARIVSILILVAVVLMVVAKYL